MEYYLCRGMELARLSQDQLYKLHEHEKSERTIIEYDPMMGIGKTMPKDSRALMPYEIQQIFNLPPLKETWQIPDRDPQQAEHSARLRKDFRSHGLLPEYGDLKTGRVDVVHEWDDKFLSVFERGAIDLIYHGQRKRGKLSDDIDNPPPFNDKD